MTEHGPETHEQYVYSETAYRLSVATLSIASDSDETKSEPMSTDAISADTGDSNQTGEQLRVFATAGTDSAPTPYRYAVYRRTYSDARTSVSTVDPIHSTVKVGSPNTGDPHDKYSRHAETSAPVEQLILDSYAN